MTTIGIPRALLYYQYFPMWQRFCQELGLELVVSVPTTQTMLADGASRVVSDTCLPVKVYLGHVLSLVDKCDWLFIPAIRSVETKVYNCSKFLGLPDMTRAVIPESPPILEIDIDINKGRSELYQEVNKLARHFTKNPMKIRQARIAAWETYLEYIDLMAVKKIAPPAAIDLMSIKYGWKLHENNDRKASEHKLAARSGRVVNQHRSETKASIALVGHPYLLNDEYINHRLVARLEQLGNRVLMPEMVKSGPLNLAVNELTGGAYWTYEQEVVGAGGYFLENEADGVIGVMAFGCGPDSLMMDAVRRQAARLKSTPFMCLTLEEHTAEAGVVTRLEAFTDMLHRKKRKEAEVCA